MRVLVVRGNPRKNGVCAKLADLFVSGLKTGGAEVSDFDASGVSPCLGCFACKRGGSCVRRDVMDSVLPALLSADALVCVSPVYFYSMSAQLKAFFDRCFPLVNGYSYDAQSGRFGTHTAFDVQKKFVSISAAFGRGDGTFDALSQTYRAIAVSMGFDYCADIRRGESVYFGSLGENSVRVRRILESFARAGEEFAKTGAISPETVSAAESPIAPSDEAFSKRAAVFWRTLNRK